MSNTTLQRRFPTVSLTPVLLAAETAGLPVVRIHQIFSPCSVEEIVTPNAFARGRVDLDGRHATLVDLRRRPGRRTGLTDTYLILADVLVMGRFQQTMALLSDHVAPGETPAPAPRIRAQVISTTRAGHLATVVPFPTAY